MPIAHLNELGPAAADVKIGVTNDNTGMCTKAFCFLSLSRAECIGMTLLHHSYHFSFIQGFIQQ